MLFPAFQDSQAWAQCSAREEVQSSPGNSQGRSSAGAVGACHPHHGTHGSSSDKRGMQGETEVANPTPDFSPFRMENKFSSWFRVIPSPLAPIPQQQATGRWHIPS